MTVYLPVDAARKLAVYCAEQDCDVSAAIARMVECFLPRPAANRWKS